VELRAEQGAAWHVGISWKHRGPAAPDDANKHDTWRGQKYRPGSQRWANNGGTRAWWYNTYYPLKRKASESGKEEDTKTLQQWLLENPMPEKSTKGASNMSGKGKGDAAPSGAYGGTAPSSAYGGAAPSGAYGGAAPSGAYTIYGGASSSGAYVT
jgi:hypothetical protein